MERKSRKRKSYKTSPVVAPASASAPASVSASALTPFAPAYRVGKHDPLFQIFERHLYEFNYETRESFINTVVKEYIEWISKDRLVVPSSKRSLLEATLVDEVSDMLVRKIYGCLQVEAELEEAHKLSEAAKNADQENRRAVNSREAQSRAKKDLKKRQQKLAR